MDHAYQHRQCKNICTSYLLQPFTETFRLQVKGKPESEGYTQFITVWPLNEMNTEWNYPVTTLNIVQENFYKSEKISSGLFFFSYLKALFSSI